MLGSSFGALIGLTMVAAHPGQIRTLVAHDPATMRLLPAHLRARAERDLNDLTETFRRDGALSALKRLGELVDADFSDREPDILPPPPPGPERIPDLAFFLSRDLPQLREAELDATHIAAIKAGPTRVVPAAGRGSRKIWNHDCAQALAALLDTDVDEFPGGHSLSTHPTAFAARLREVISGRRTDHIEARRG
jgi:pimeloyl-ACP methyl ester carboxylesterase